MNLTDLPANALRQTRLACPSLARCLAVASGLLLALCYPRFNVEGLVWVWMAPLLWALWFLPPRNPHRRARRGFALGYLAGLAFFLVNIGWIRQVTPVWPAKIAGWLILSSYLALYFGLWGAFAATVARPWDERLARPADGRSAGRAFSAAAHSLACAFLAAGAWCGGEWLRGWLLTGFGWNGLGVALHRNVFLTQIADLVGVTGLSFLPMFVGCVLVITARRFRLEIKHSALRPHLDFGVAVLLVLAVFSYGLRTTSQLPSSVINLRGLLVQGGVPQALKFDPAHSQQILADYEKLTAEGLAKGPCDLVLWPESSLPTPLFDDPAYEPYLDRILGLGNFALIMGVDDFSPEGAYNAAALMRGRFRDPNLQVYRKIHLVPFGEFVPYRKQLPFMGKVFGGLVPGDFDRGTSREPLPLGVPPVDLIPLICFEDTVGRLARKFVRPQPQVIVNLTNDGWFHFSEESEQHLANARFRAIELRRPMLRVCNTGVTCAIDIYGRTTAALPSFKDGQFVQDTLATTVEVSITRATTFFSRHGDAFTLAVSLLCLPATLRSWRRRDRRA